MTEVIYPDGRKKVFGNSRFCAGKEPFKFPLYLLGGIGAAIRCGEEICAFRKRGVPDAGIRPCKGKHVLRHYDGSAFTPFCFNYRSEEHTSELQSRFDLVCRLLLEKKKIVNT